MNTWLMPALTPSLPIDEVLGELSAALAKSTAAALVAPPGAGKTTRVPLALLDAPWAKGKKIIVLEPRRIAARASADPDVAVDVDPHAVREARLEIGRAHV